MVNSFTALLIDDHPLITGSFKTALEQVFNSEKENLETIIVHDIDSALKKINNPTFLKEVNLIFLDISLPSKNENILSGEDLGIKIKQISPDVKIIVSTSFNDNYRIHTILKNINPEGFLVKNDLDPEVLLMAIKTVLNNTPYYSKTVLEFFKKHISNEYVIDTVDRKLLHELSIGTKMSELPTILPLSKAGIEKRKINLKKLFEVEEKSDRRLIQLAREKGFI
jgi:DNA-binding NarL/FixJ family response regulator